MKKKISISKVVVIRDGVSNSNVVNKTYPLRVLAQNRKSRITLISRDDPEM